MYYTDADEMIVRNNDSDRPNTVWIPSGGKTKFRHELERLLSKNIETTLGNPNVREREWNIDFYKEVLNIVPMWCNMLIKRGTKRLLFVSYINSRENSWMRNDATVPRGQTQWPVDITFPDYAVPEMLAMFIPIVLKKYNYDIEVVVVKPPQPKHQACIHKLYDDYEIAHVSSNCQYKHADNTSFYIKDADQYERYFDTVLFNNVPLVNDSFSLSDVLDCFDPVTTTDCSFIDMSDTMDKQFRFLNDEGVVGVHDSLELMLQNRREWGGDIRGDWYGSPSHWYSFMERFIKICNRNYTTD